MLFRFIYPAKPTVYILMSNEAPPHFQKITHTHENWTHDVYICGTGPIVVLLHEIPNPTPEAFALADRLSKSGFMVHVPIFFGKVNAPFSTGRAISELCLGCIRKEFLLVRACLFPV